MKRRHAMLDVATLILLPERDAKVVKERAGTNRRTSMSVLRAWSGSFVHRAPLGVKRLDPLNIASAILVAGMLGYVAFKAVTGQEIVRVPLSDSPPGSAALLAMLGLAATLQLLRGWMRANPELGAMRHIRTRLLRRAMRGEFDAETMMHVGTAIHERRHFWFRQFGKGPRWRAWWQAASLDPVSYGLMAVFFSGILLNGAMNLLLYESFAFACACAPMLVMCGGGLAGLLVRGRALCLRCRRALPARTCADCGYALGGLTPAIEPEQLGGCNVGPVRCPECSAPWPLVPAPVSMALAVERRTCPRCAYDLSGLKPAGPGPSGRRVVGPAVCPECGLERPLVRRSEAKTPSVRTVGAARG